jgi:hypothetical protein
VTLTYGWKILEKPVASTATFNDATLANPSFTPDKPGIYRIQLEVSDGAASDVAMIQISADPVIYVGANTGFEVEYVTGGAFFNSPEGVTVDAAGNIYVAQNGSGVVTRTSNGLTEYFSAGGYLRTIHDIEYYPAGNSFFVASEGFNSVVTLDNVGVQSLFTSFGGIQTPEGIDIFVNAAGVDQMIVSERNNDILRFYNPASAAPAASTGSNNFNGNLNNPWGVAGLANANYYFAVLNGDDELWRSNGAATTVINTNFNNPHDVVISPSGALIVSDSGLGIVYMIPNCAGGNCPATLLAWGPWQPWGLGFESDTSLLVTDRAGNSLYRITGTF